MFSDDNVMVDAVLFYLIPAGQWGAIRRRDQLPGRKLMALICCHYSGTSHNTQTDTRATCHGVAIVKHCH